MAPYRWQAAAEHPLLGSRRDRTPIASSRARGWDRNWEAAHLFAFAAASCRHRQPSTARLAMTGARRRTAMVAVLVIVYTRPNELTRGSEKVLEWEEEMEIEEPDEGEEEEACSRHAEGGRADLFLVSMVIVSPCPSVCCLSVCLSVCCLCLSGYNKL
eukprot:scaffold9168_cov126-Isochrysis_galbana.AAC.2